jgi:hypothetical protein
MFLDEKIAKSFIKRNLPKEWQKGAVTLCDEDLKHLRNKGCDIEVYDYPKKIGDLKDIEIGFEIHEFQEVPMYRTSHM